MSNSYYEKYIKYKNKYLKLKQFGGAKHNDEYTACEVENKLLKKPASVLIYTMQFPLSMLSPTDEEKYVHDDLSFKYLKDMQASVPDFYIITTENEAKTETETDDDTKIIKKKIHVFTPREPHEMMGANYMDDLLTSKYTHIFSDNHRVRGDKILNDNKSSIPADYKGSLVLIRNGSRGFAVSVLNLNTNKIDHSILTKEKHSGMTQYPYLNDAKERNPEYMKLFLSSSARDLRGPGASTLGYMNYYKKLGVTEPNIKIIFNTDSIEDKEREFSSLDSNSHVIFIGHCCDSSNNIVSDNTHIETQGRTTIVNPNLTAEHVVHLLTFIPTARDSNKSALVNFNICNGHSKFVEGTLIERLNTVRIRPLLISKTEIVGRFAGLATPAIEENIFNHTCGTPTMITFWNEKMGYTSVNANIFNISKETIFRNE